MRPSILLSLALLTASLGLVSSVSCGSSSDACETNCGANEPPPHESSGPRGELDPSFADGAGFRVVNVPGTGYPYPGALRRAPDGSFVFSVNRESAHLFRFTADGDPDEAWGGRSGARTLDSTKIQTTADIAIDHAGRTLALSSKTAPSGKAAYVLARLQPNGEPDTSFGAGGYMDPVERPASDFYGSRVFEREDKKLLVVGKVVENGQSSRAFTLVNADGTLDTSFGIGGFKTHAGSVDDGAVIRLADGTIVISEPLVLVAYDSNGDPRPSFGNAGRVDLTPMLTADAGYGQTRLEIAPASNGLVGCWDEDVAEGTRFGAVRFASNGALDTTFTATGFATALSPKDSPSPACSTVANAVTSRVFLGGISVISLGNGTGWAAELGGDGGVDLPFSEGLARDAGLLRANIFQIYLSLPDTKARAIVAGTRQATPFIARIFL